MLGSSLCFIQTSQSPIVPAIIIRSFITFNIIYNILLIVSENEVIREIRSEPFKVIKMVTSH